MHVHRSLALLIGILLFGCQQGGQSGPGSSSPFNQNGQFGSGSSGAGSSADGGGSLFQSNADTTLADSVNPLQQAMSSLGQPKNAAEAEAMQLVDGFVDRYEGLYAPLSSQHSSMAGLEYNRLLAELKKWWKNRPSWTDPPQWWPPVEEAIKELLSKRDVHEYYHYTAYRHFWTIDPQEGANVAIQWGFNYHGVSFRVYEKPQNSCDKAIYRCYVDEPYYVWFLHTDPQCGGYTPAGKIGYICHSQKAGVAHYPLSWYYHPVLGIHYYTRDPAFHSSLVAWGWILSGTLGYPPN